MVDASRKDASEKKKTGVSVKFKKGIKIAVFAAVVAGAGYGLWKNPQVAEQVKNWLGTSAAAEEKENETAVLREEVRDLRVQLNNLQRQFYEQQDNSVLMEKFANLERYNLNVINSKADVAAVLGLVMRMDKAEQKLEAVAGATDRGALVLTAAMLVFNHFLTLDAILGDVSVAGLSLRSIQGDRVMGEILARCGHVPGQAPGPLAPFVADLGDCPDLGPILMTLGLFCQGESRLLNAGRLRLKESDRGTAMAQELGKLGGQASLAGDEIRIRQSRLRPGPALSSHGDHRIAMALAVAALGARIPADIQGAEAVEKSYPDFWKDLAHLGARVELCHG